MVCQSWIKIQTERYNQFIPISEHVKEVVKASGVTVGVVYVITNHTTTGIAINESLECLESDIEQMLCRLVPEDFPYAHARMLRTYGATAGNPTGHLKSHLTGNHCVIPVVDGEIKSGDAQEVYLMEFDGPQLRTINITVMGE